MSFPFQLTTVSVASVGLLFLAYYFISKSKYLFSNLCNKFGEEQGQIRYILLQRLIGVICFGIIPVLIIFAFANGSLNKYGLALKNGQETVIWLLIISPVLIAVNYRAARNASNLAIYPQIRAKNWNLSLLALSALSWLVYLFAYEFMFRGFLFFSCLGELDLVAAILINTSIYSLTHLPKGIKETIGAIPLGIVLCIATYRTETIWVAFGAHSVLALSNEWFSLKYNKEIELGFKNAEF
jgi:membrane protease YdiL (CAAX protease family)